MKKIFVFLLTFVALNSFADRVPATSTEPNGDGQAFDQPGPVQGGTNVLGLNCPECNKFHKAKETKLLGDTDSVYRGGPLQRSNSTGGTNEGTN